ncbi:hypothetical protein [Curtobacterium sp. SAFR-003]|uniref:hypothetical protein n=1 Tax=Curtobacterium sp. SAFR-003 TaxID=3387276 RepID=UPI003F81C055
MVPQPNFRTLSGVIAHGRDYGRRDEPPKYRQPTQPTPEQEEFLIRSSRWWRQAYEGSREAVARGELEEIERRTRREGLVATLADDEVADWLGISCSELDRLLATGVVTAFVCGEDLRYPAWQFTDDPSLPVLPGLARLTREWGDQMHPSAIHAFMYNADLEIKGTDEPFTPVEWLAIGGDVQVVIDNLKALRLR